VRTRARLWIGVGIAALTLAALNSPSNALRIDPNSTTPDGDPTEETIPTTRRTTTTTTTLPPTVQLRAGGPSAAPTVGLTSIANAMVLRTKSVTGVLTIPAGLPISNPVYIDVAPDGSSETAQYYYPGSGNKFVMQFLPGGGAEHQQRLDVHLTEFAPDGTTTTYDLVWAVTVKPLYEVSISPLTFYQETDCDPWPYTDAENNLEFFGVDGKRHHAGFDTQAGSTTIRTEVAGNWHDVALDGSFLVPTVYWWENDVDLGFHAFPINQVPLRPFDGGTKRWHEPYIEGLHDCSAWLSYTTVVILNTYSDF
jgi:hypothetical protein